MSNKVTEAIKYVGTFKFWKELVIMTLGMMVCASAVYYFLVPSKLIIGTISGLSIVLSNIFGSMGINITVGTLVTIINIILLILAFLLIDREFGFKTVYTALILGPLVDMWEKVLPIETLLEPGQTSLMNDPWFDLLCFVLILSASQTILFHINASTGGLDILAKIINKYMHVDIGAAVTVAGAIICCTAFAINPFRMVVIGLIGTWMNGLFLDYFMTSINRRKRVCIIARGHEDDIRQYITGTLERGCSLYDVTGGYSGEKGQEIQALLTKDEFANLMEFIKDQDIHAFITAGNVSEIYGRWNHPKHKKVEK